MLRALSILVQWGSAHEIIKKYTIGRQNCLALLCESILFLQQFQIILLADFRRDVCLLEALSLPFFLLLISGWGDTLDLAILVKRI